LFLLFLFYLLVWSHLFEFKHISRFLNWDYFWNKSLCLVIIMYNFYVHKHIKYFE
jgi:hypothetical protein